MNRKSWVVGLGVAVCTSCATVPTRAAQPIDDDGGWSQFDVTRTARPDALYMDRFEALQLRLEFPVCLALSARVNANTAAPILVVVHGIGGDGPEWENSLSLLVRSQPAAVFMFRWDSMHSRDEMVQNLAAGVTQLVQCTGRRVVMLAHSAGGVLASYAASLISVPESGQVDVVTIASPLAGTLDRKPHDSGEAQLFFLFDLGTRISNYPQPGRGVSVWHLSTQYPADKVMKPGKDGISPNDPRVKVPGATVLSLPARLSHVAALSFVARRISREGWTEWMNSLIVSTDLKEAQ